MTWNRTTSNLRAIGMLIFGILLTSGAHAGIGFDQVALPQPVQKAKEGVFLIFAKSGSNFEIGSASVIAQEPGDKTQSVYLLTAQHVVQNYCPATGFCKGIEISREPRMDFSKSYWQDERKFLRTGTVEIIAADAAQDLALLKIQWREKNLPVLHLAPGCAPVSASRFLVGFPLTYFRWNTEGIVQPEKLFKRTSAGEAMKPAYFVLQTGKLEFEPTPGTYKLDGLSADSLPGNSGSPVLDEAGQLVGVTKASGARSFNNYHYTDGPNPHTAAVPCQVVQSFLSSFNF